MVVLSHRTVYSNIRRLFGFWLLPAMLIFGLVFTLYDLDRQRYMRAKRNIINESFYEIFPLPETLQAQALEVLYGTNEERKAAANKGINTTLQKIVNGPLPIFRVIILDENGNEIRHFENTHKYAEFNSFKNNLILRTFYGISEFRIPSPIVDSTGRRKSGRLQLFYTTPANYPPIEKLTNVYRLYVLLILAGFFGAYWILNRTLLRPLIVVTNKLQENDDNTISLIDNPRSDLELGFNSMAGQALAQNVRNRLSIFSQPDVQARIDAITDAFHYVTQLLPIRSLSVAQIIDDHIVLTVTYPQTEKSGMSKEELLSRANAEAASSDVTPFEWNRNTDIFAYSEKHETISIVVNGRLQAGAYQHSGGNNLIVTVERVCRSIAQGVLAQVQTGVTMHKQRSEASMTLSRNLGHDLTNIIATSKLDLMAINQLINSKKPLDDTRAGMLRAAVTGLSQSTQFLQEIVNIYRSFSHIRQPAYERHHVNILINDFLEAFTPTVSGHINFERDLNAQPDSLIVEPRLVKLALFNLLTNAVRALRQQTDEAGLLPHDQRITIRTTIVDKLFVIEVIDNGPGIRDSRGELLASIDLPHIFDYGYTTKEQSGEGMGLDWVRTIAVKFHNGIAEAENRPEGGALFRIGLRDMETAEASIPDKSDMAPIRKDTSSATMPKGN